MPVEKFVHPLLDVFKFVKPDPSPVNAVATTDPPKVDSPTTRKANEFAVVPIPTPSLSTANREVPDPTCSLLRPGEVVAMPTASNRPMLRSLERLTLPNLLQLFSTV